MTRPDPRTAADWRAIQSALLVDVAGYTGLAEQTRAQVALPRLIAVDYAIRLARAYREMAQAAQDAADQAGRYAQDAPCRDCGRTLHDDDESNTGLGYHVDCTTDGALAGQPT